MGYIRGICHPVFWFQSQRATTAKTDERRHDVANINSDNARTIADAIANIDAVATTARNLTQHYFTLLDATVGERHPSQILENRIASYVAVRKMRSCAIAAQTLAAHIEDHSKKGDFGAMLQASADFADMWTAYLEAEKVLIAVGSCYLTDN